MGVAPRKAQILGQRLDGEVPSGPLSHLFHNVVVQINRISGVEKLFDGVGAANVGIFLLKGAIYRALIF
jgi:hypothetical protein